VCVCVCEGGTVLAAFSAKKYLAPPIFQCWRSPIFFYISHSPVFQLVGAHYVQNRVFRFTGANDRTQRLCAGLPSELI
jgi:hypothetical protein